ncbi:MAG: 4Fe-4S dicluster domain-containing protein [Candidatus Aenigmatarchaeota archaeon]|nr:MAG: 4Fe-4S dicluster domain-containing protein [Candidatus Aenigmarchaeota archaeon]
MVKQANYTMEKKDLQKFLGALASKMDVYAPVKTKGRYNFSRLKRGQEIELAGYSNTEFPPREILMPEGETLVRYARKTICEVFDERKKVLFGVRPCDVHGIIVLDKVMMGHGDMEMHYVERRKSTLIIALNCTEAGENCFCESMETDTLTGGFDILLTDAGERYHVEVGTPEGAKLVKGAGRIFTETLEKPVKPKPGCEKKLDMNGLPDMMKRAAKSKIWEDVAKRCLSCACCTFSCPTCFCFSLKHEPDMTDLSKGEIKREMDYCMLLRFSRVAGNMVFRQHRAERVKQFFYHKLVYGMENEGKSHCVGCGRCITECMAHIDITEEAAKVRKSYGR